jgi:hypothetical protein
MVQCFLSGHCGGPRLKEAREAISDAGPTQRNGVPQTSCCAIGHETKANEGEAGPRRSMTRPIRHAVIVTPGPQCSCAQAAGVNASATTAAHRAHSLLALLEPAVGSHLELLLAAMVRKLPPWRCDVNQPPEPNRWACAACTRRNAFSGLTPVGRTARSCLDFGTNAKCRARRAMSEFKGRAEDIYPGRVFRIL